MEATRVGALEMVRILVSEGAEINTQDERGWTALMEAVKWGRLEMVRFLVGAGAALERPR